MNRILRIFYNEKKSQNKINFEIDLTSLLVNNNMRLVFLIGLKERNINFQVFFTIFY